MPEQNNNILSNLEGNYKASHRFRRVSDLWDRYEKVHSDNKKKREAWENFILAYERWSYVRSCGGTDPNWGQFRGKVDKIIETFESLVTERQHWAQITPIDLDREEMEREGLDKDFISDKITSEFHELCIRPWEDRESNVRLSLFDMVMFSKGIDMWERPHGTYPESVPVDRVYPDSEAGMKPKEWDLCFVEKKYTPVELFEEVQDEDRADALGWRKSAVLSLLKTIGSTGTDTSTHGLTDEKHTSASTGSASSSSGASAIGACNPDLKLTVIMAYVKEYRPDEDGNQISLYVFVHNRHLKTDNDRGSGKPKESPSNVVGFLRIHKGIAKDMSEVFAVSSHLIARNYYRCPSEAEMVYAACRFYDQGINRTIRAVMRNMALMLKSQNQDQQEKLRNLDQQEAIVLDPDVDILQQRTFQDVKGVVETVRQVMLDTDQAAGINQAAGSQNVKGRAITASEANIQLTEASNSQRKDIRLYTLAEKRKLSEMYRRFVSEDTMMEDDEGYKMHKLFIKRMKEAGIKKKYYDPDNVLVEPVFFNFGEAPSVIVEKAQMRLQALRQLSTATTPGEQRTIRDIIAATSSYQEAEQYMDRDDNESFLEKSVIKAGVENELMSDPYLNRKNIHVSSGDKHMIELPIHLQDIEFKLNNGIGLMQNLEQTAEEQVPIILDDITDIVVALDNQGAHVEAHLQLAARDPQMKDAVKGMRDKLNQLRRTESILEQQLSITQQSRV